MTAHAPEYSFICRDCGTHVRTILVWNYRTIPATLPVPVRCERCAARGAPVNDDTPLATWDPRQGW